MSRDHANMPGMEHPTKPGPAQTPAKPQITEHIDPVCGMKLEGQDGAGIAEYKGTTYYFDSEECMVKFNENPERYAGPSTEEEPGDHCK